MSREVRRIPASWIHPTYEFGCRKGEYRPLRSEKFEDDLDFWKKYQKQWCAGLVFSYSKNSWIERTPDKGEDYEEEYGPEPSRSDYMPTWTEEASHFQMYETTSEGTPISPVLESPEALARWLVADGASAFANQTASYEAWLRVAQGGFAPSLVGTMGREMTSGIAAFVDVGLSEPRSTSGVPSGDRD